MRLSIIVVAWLMAMSVSYLPAHSSETRAQMSEMIGEIPASERYARQISFGSVTPIDINRDLIAKGDRLDLYKRVEDGSLKSFANKSSFLKRVGSMVVLSVSGSSPTGKIIKLSEEIDEKAYVAFSLPESSQLNQYLPFIKSLADTFVVRPEFGPLKIAAIDAIDPFGDRTELTDALFEKVIQRICERPQFLCANQSDVARILRKHRIATSGNIGSAVERELLAELGVEVMVTGNVLRTEKKIDFLLRARSTRNGARPRQVWRLFTFPENAMGVAKLSQPGKITYRNMASERGWLKIRLRDVESAEGLKVEYFFHEPLSDHLTGGGHGMLSARPVNFFIKLNGLIYREQGDGLFYHDAVPAGNIEITAGYYLEITIDGETKILTESPVQRTFSIYVEQGDDFHLEIIGTVEKGSAIIAADSYLSKKRS